VYYLRWSKKAALNLSVEAIIIFVLAFAMLGVGLFITDLLREGAGEGIEKVLGSLDDIEEKPTSVKPITGITKEGFNLPFNRVAKLSLGFYNKGNTPAPGATVLIHYCKSGETGVPVSGNLADPTTHPIRVYGISADVGQSEAVVFELSLQNNDDALAGGLYFCKLSVVESDEETEVVNAENIYEQKQVAINVVS